MGQAGRCHQWTDLSYYPPEEWQSGFVFCLEQPEHSDQELANDDCLRNVPPGENRNEPGLSLVRPAWALS
jgi:hypothetical protein